jgi:DNA-binding NarL/FixJ family response regulator
MEPRLAYARSADDVEIAYTDVGAGPPLVMLPNLPFSNCLAQWRVPFLREAYERLAAHHRVIEYDGRGTGRSDRDIEALSLDTMLLDLEAVLGHASIRSCALYAPYISCATAIAYAARHPERVTSIILFGGSARGRDAIGAPETAALLSLIERDWDVFVTSALQAWLGWNAGESGRIETEVARTATTPDVARAVISVAADLDVSKELATVTAPLLVFHRRGVRQISLEVSEAIVATVPNGQLYLLEGSSAALFFEDADEVLRVMLDFLGKRPTARPSDPSHSAAVRRPGGHGLTAREIDVLALLAKGETNSEIASRLGLSVNTVERHVTNLYRKIDARGRADATAFAVRRGIV